jgi:hypothetical protein
MPMPNPRIFPGEQPSLFRKPGVPRRAGWARRLHGLIERIPHTFRYRVTDTGMRSAQFLTRIHDRLLRTW